jgi:RNA polymerase sigma-70 factor (ECF subfamily)
MTDSEIIRLIIDGDRQIFRILVEKYQAMVFRTCMGFVHNKDDADDLTQEVFIQAYQSLPGFRGKSAFSTWIYRIAVNASLNKVRKNKSNHLLYRLDTLFGTTREKENSLPLYDNENPESILIRKENNKWVQKSLDSLSENQRIALVLSKYDDLSQKEIAEIMKTTEGAVEALIHRAKTNLKKIFSSYFKNNE